MAQQRGLAAVLPTGERRLIPTAYLAERVLDAVCREWGELARSYILRYAAAQRKATTARCAHCKRQYRSVFAHQKYCCRRCTSKARYARRLEARRIIAALH
jgi:tRNA(Ile2) C34 agmatinyltransferase TiaS